MLPNHSTSEKWFSSPPGRQLFEGTIFNLGVPQNTNFKSTCCGEHKNHSLRSIRISREIAILSVVEFQENNRNIISQRECQIMPLTTDNILYPTDRPIASITEVFLQSLIVRFAGMQ